VLLESICALKASGFKFERTDRLSQQLEFKELPNYNTLQQYNITRCTSAAQEEDEMCLLQCVAVCCSVLQCDVACCSLLQCVAASCSVLQRVAACCSVLQCVAVCCSVLQ